MNSFLFIMGKHPSWSVSLPLLTRQPLILKNIQKLTVSNKSSSCSTVNTLLHYIETHPSTLRNDRATILGRSLTSVVNERGVVQLPNSKWVFAQENFFRPNYLTSGLIVCHTRRINGRQRPAVGMAILHTLREYPPSLRTVPPSRNDLHLVA